MLNLTFGKIFAIFSVLASQTFGTDINIVPEGKKIILLSSKQISTMVPRKIMDTVINTARGICERHGMTFVSFKQASVEPMEIVKGSYIATKQNLATNNLVWEEKKFEFVYPTALSEAIANEIQYLHQLESYCYKGAAGMSVFLITATTCAAYFAPREIAIVIGTFSIALTGLSWGAALLARLQAKELAKQRVEVEEEPGYFSLLDEGVIAIDASPGKVPEYALPILASELWCRQ